MLLLYISRFWVICVYRDVVTFGVITSMENYLKHVSSLIVDDQVPIRMLIRRILKDIGCRRIKEASNVNDA